jgi:hypothetical protein
MLRIKYSDPSGAEKREVSASEAASRKDRFPPANPSQELDTSTAILKKKKKPNSLM